jgi:acyl carrier protein
MREESIQATRQNGYYNDIKKSFVWRLSNMNNLSKYNDIFLRTFGVDENQLQGLTYRDIPAWDSVGHMVMTSAVEEAFDIIMNTEDMINFSSYEKGKEILSKYGIKF